jgi:hypothetical protein
MPGSGKTLTVVEAAQMVKLRHVRFKMSNVKDDDVQSYLARAVSIACKCEPNDIPFEH